MGLRRTDILKKRTSARKDVRHSPFRRAHVLYPFLVIEAKRDKNGQGFHDIGIQTAFSITTLLKLQQDLSSRSGISLNPLVWFLANRGDFWRISGCITDGPQFVCCIARKSFKPGRGVLTMFRDLSIYGVGRLPVEMADCSFYQIWTTFAIGHATCIYPMFSGVWPVGMLTCEKSPLLTQSPHHRCLDQILLQPAQPI